MEKKIGKVTHYYEKIGVAAIELQDDVVHPGDHLHIVGHTTDADVMVESIELEHRPLNEAHPGQNVGVRIHEHVREHDDVYKTSI